jgi:FxsC-like protein
MSDTLFFLSYARGNFNPYMKKFVDDLAQAVRERIVHPPGQVVFFDQKTMEPGVEWDPALLEALQSSRVLVALYSPWYFASDYCGKEWGLFRMRQEAFARETGATTRPPVILPVLWLPPGKPEELPPVALQPQFTHLDLGEVYQKEGLQELVSLADYADEYLVAVRTLAKLIIEHGKAQKLPRVPEVASAASIPNIFAREPDPLPRPRVDPATVNGPRYVQFVFVAARREELEAVSGDMPSPPLSAYGEEGGMDWQPFHPHDPVVSQLATEITYREGLVYDPMRVTDDLIERIQLARDRRKIVILVVDLWTLSLERYAALMQRYDERRFYNSVVLVPWSETASAHRAQLEGAVLQSFPNLTNPADPNSFVDAIASPDDFRKELAAALTRARLRVLNAARAVRKMPGDVPKPSLEGPGSQP